MILGENGIAYQQVGLDSDIMLNVSQFPSGLYFLVVNLGGFKRAFKKFTIVH